MRHHWPHDHTVMDLFDSPSFGMLWLGSDTEWVHDLSKEQAARILKTTVRAIEAEEIQQAIRAFFGVPAS